MSAVAATALTWNIGLSKADEHLANAIKYDSKFLYAHAQRGV